MDISKSSHPSNPRVTVFGSRNVAGMTDDARTEGLPLADALTREWSGDAHFAAYAPCTLPVQGEERRVTVRLLAHAKDDDHPAAYDVLDWLDAPPRMVAFVGDVDAPEHEATDEWRAETLPRIRASGLSHYRTRGGYRVLATLATPFEITTPANAAAWSAWYEGQCDRLASEHGLVLDRACADWTRLYRLPNVTRDGEPQRAPVVGQLPALECAPVAVDVKATPRGDAAIGAVGAEHTTRSAALAEAMADAYAAGGRQEGNALQTALGWCLGKGVRPGEVIAIVDTLSAGTRERAKHLNLARRAKALDGPTDAVRDWLGAEAFASLDALLNPSDAARMRRKSEVAANDTDANDTGPHGVPAGAGASANAGELAFVSLDGELEALDYVCEGLALASSLGKVSVLFGEGGCGKGPLANHLAICIATGRKAFGALPVRQQRTAILDFEGARLTRRRLKRIAAAIGVELTELEGKLFLIDGTQGTLEEITSRVGTFVRERGIGSLIIDSYTSAQLGEGIDSAKPEYAKLAKNLGALGIHVLCVAHSTKEGARRKARPEPSDLAHSSALYQMAQTVIALWQKGDDENLKIVSCVRAPEGKFADFEVRFSGDAKKNEPLAVCHAGNPLSEREQKKAAEEAKAKDAKEEKARERAAKIANAEALMLEGLASSADRELSGRRLAELAGVHVSKPGPADGPAILAGLVREGWLVRDDRGPRRAYFSLPDELPASPPAAPGGFERATAERHKRLAAAVHDGQEARERGRERRLARLMPGAT